MTAHSKLNLADATFHRLVRCGECNAVVKISALQRGQRALCPRCQNVLYATSRWSLKRCSIIAISILILMPFALTYPLLSIDLLGEKIDASVWLGVWKMATQGFSYTAFLVFLCAVFMPIAFALLVILLRLSRIMHIKPRNLLISLSYIKPWVMFDVYLVALGVSIFKVQEYATLELNIYLIAFIFTALLTTLLFIKINPDEVWNDFYPQSKAVNNLTHTEDLRYCHSCQYSFINPLTDRKGREICPRCYSQIDLPNAVKLQRTWALLIAGIIMLFPANLLPMSVIYLNGAPSTDTLMSGVISFIDMGSYFIAFVVFTASIFVPISKVLIMLYLLTCIHFKLKHSIRWQMRLLHIVHFVGRWSMLDLFVLALMMSLVTRGQIIDFSVGTAALYFGAAVFLTMIAAEQFDSRLIWEIYDRQQAKHATSK
ncbi:paraquat-inducible protein A [Aggregatibacter actinomycetemcomitans]|uniref:paraquat-inducible protein A n=1 Tax=Aggregatibacter actinomycetemcomitans TaxID=714 RepID=UPI001E28714B|nr:paraquat-inducible protein A [Aggregatibacter actinomycetemcomitans]